MTYPADAVGAALKVLALVNFDPAPHEGDQRDEVTTAIKCAVSNPQDAEQHPEPGSED